MLGFGLVTTLFVGSGLIAPLVKAQLDSSSSITCDCGFRDENNNVWTNVWFSDYQQSEGNVYHDATAMDLKRDKNYLVMDYTMKRENYNYTRIFSKNNVNLSPQSAQLIVRSNSDGDMTSASFGTERNDFLYGTFRASIKMPSAPGTVAAFYYYESDSAEIDMETLGRYTDPRQSFFAIHPQIYNDDGTASNLTHIKHPLDFDPTTEFNEYRFDWAPDSVGFYLNGQLASTLDTNIPSTPGRVILNHWTDSNPKFSGVAPMDQDILMEVANLTFFFNSTQDASGPPCQSNHNACDVKDITSRRLLPFDKSPPTSSSSSPIISSTSLFPIPFILTLLPILLSSL
ncbi:unnamed protein product [Absidia cylindrospora]